MDFHNFLHRISQEREYEAQRFCFILGAGASYDCGIAKANDLVDQWYNELLDRCCQHGQWKEILRLPREEALKETINAIKSDGSLLEEIFSPTKWETTRSFTTADLIRIKFMEDESEKYSKLFAYTFPTATMRRTFIKNFTKEGSPQKGHEALSRLLCETDNNIVITTNFDRIVEMAIQNSGYSRDLILLKDCEDQSCAAFDKNNCLSLTFQNQKNNAPLVIKAHGDVDRIRQKNTIEELRQLPDSFYQKLKSIFQIYKPIFIGYSGNDSGLVDLLVRYATTKTISSDSPGCYWLVYGDDVPHPEDRLSESVRMYLKGVNGECITHKGFESAICDIVSTLLPDLKPDKSRVSGVMDKQKSVIKNITSDEKKYSSVDDVLAQNKLMLHNPLYRKEN